MKKIIFVVLFVCLGAGLFAQNGVDLSLGFQYGTARIFDKGNTIRQIDEPGVLLSVRVYPGTIGFAGRIGLLFPSSVTEWGVTLDSQDFDYMLFINAGLCISGIIPMNDRFAFLFDAGLSINDLTYGGSYRDTIDASWTIRLENMGAPMTMSGGHKFENIRMKESYNDFSLGIIGNAAVRLNFTRRVYIELGAAASFDFWRTKTFEFSADLTSGDSNWPANALSVFPPDKLDSDTNPTKLTLSSDEKGSTFKHFTFIPSLSIGFSFK